MSSRKIIWLPRVKRKIVQYRSVRFTPEETYDFIAETILEVEVLLSNPILSRSYIEEMGEYKGITRVVINKFRFYYEQIEDVITVVAVLFPGENQSTIIFSDLLELEGKINWEG